MIKQILSLIVVIITAMSANAQSFTLTFPSTSYSGPPNQLLEAPVTVENISGAELHLLVLRKTNTLASGHDSYFCWSINCYGPPTSLSTDTVHLLPGATDNSFKGYLSPTLGTSGTSVVEYCFFDYNTPGDSVCVTFNYLLDPALSVGELQSDRIFSMPYPNPSNQIVMFQYDISGYKSGSIKIYDVLGSLVKEVALTDKKAVVVIPVKELNAGIYLANIIADGKKIVTRRLIVTHK
jgi:hypothetical protein